MSVNMIVVDLCFEGILDAASSVVDVLQTYFPEYMDKLPRESAFFKGPIPSLLDSLHEEHILNLVMESEKTNHQEVLSKTCSADVSSI